MRHSWSVNHEQEGDGEHIADLLEAHSYQYTFAPNPNWTSFYAPAHEIRGYLEDVVTKFSVDRFIKCSHKVVKAQWDDKKAKW